MGQAAPAKMPPFTRDVLNALTYKINGAAIALHRQYGPGLLEGVYEACLAHDLRALGLQIETQKPVPLVHRGIRLNCAYRADIVVESIVLVEVKAVDALAPIHSRQLLTYLRLTNLPFGLVLNFGGLTMKDGIKRVANGYPEE